MKLFQHNRVLWSLALICINGTAFAAQSTWNSQNRWEVPQTKGSVSQTELKKVTPSKRSHTPYSPGSHNVSLDLGQVFLTGRLGDNYPDSIGGQVHYSYGVSDIFAFDSSAGFSLHKEDNADFSLFSMRSGLRVNLYWFDRIVPYALFGLGFYRPSYEVPNQKDNFSPILFGIHLGPGVTLALSDRLFFGTSIIIHNIFGSKRRVNDSTKIDTGGMYTAFFINGGVSF